jgi:exonuclease III
VALLYKKSRVDTLRTRALKVDLGEQTTRDILYVCARVDKRDTIHFFVCHLPSQRGGTAASEWKRKAAKAVLQQAVDSVFQTQAEAKIVVMGDMNSEPKDDLTGLNNQMHGLKGTHKYQGRWTCLDQFYTSPNIEGNVQIYDVEWILEPDEKYMGLRPKRTYNGIHYQNGFSDHLPIILNFEL